MIMVFVLILIITNYSLYSFGMKKDDFKKSRFNVINFSKADNSNKSKKRVSFKLSELVYNDESQLHDSLKNKNERRENLRSILVKKNRQHRESLAHEEDAFCCMPCFTVVGCSLLSCCCCMMVRLGLRS